MLRQDEAGEWVELAVEKGWIRAFEAGGVDVLLHDVQPGSFKIAYAATRRVPEPPQRAFQRSSDVPHARQLTARSELTR